MRGRKAIIEEWQSAYSGTDWQRDNELAKNQKLILEVLLDIREILNNDSKKGG